MSRQNGLGDFIIPEKHCRIFIFWLETQMLPLKILCCIHWGFLEEECSVFSKRLWHFSWLFLLPSSCEMWLEHSLMLSRERILHFFFPKHQRGLTQKKKKKKCSPCYPSSCQRLRVHSKSSFALGLFILCLCRTREWTNQSIGSHSTNSSLIGIICSLNFSTTKLFGWGSSTPNSSKRTFRVVDYPDNFWAFFFFLSHDVSVWFSFTVWLHPLSQPPSHPSFPPSRSLSLSRALPSFLPSLPLPHLHHCRRHPVRQTRWKIWPNPSLDF